MVYMIPVYKLLGQPAASSLVGSATRQPASGMALDAKVGSTGPALVAEGAGSEQCNGTYAQRGQSGGRPCYIHTANDELRVVWLPQFKAWSMAGDGKYFYKCVDETLLEESVWTPAKHGQGTAPTHSWRDGGGGIQAQRGARAGRGGRSRGRGRGGRRGQSSLRAQQQRLATARKFLELKPAATALAKKSGQLEPKASDRLRPTDRPQNTQEQGATDKIAEPTKFVKSFSATALGDAGEIMNVDCGHEYGPCSVIIPEGTSKGTKFHFSVLDTKAAATKIQAVMRGKRGRAAVEPHRQAAHVWGTVNTLTKFTRHTKVYKAEALVEAGQVMNVDCGAGFGTLSVTVPPGTKLGQVFKFSFQDTRSAASQIQAAMRGNHKRRELAEKHAAATKIQSTHRGRAARAMGLLRAKAFAVATLSTSAPKLNQAQLRRRQLLSNGPKPKPWWDKS